ncbi:hypothetical protein AXF42_Ash008081 [Apostasia shenzhenica]|uniref:Protein FATTY ACID EXPORT 3, chloroplastic n=1 Tax=Apostasia shenzhenica TaxID=1088818 RepID=A0A2I0A8J1_9ASPA|nr:hypothetical protein AXF42_Ash008081 [Apostasia shenzhenica]
MAAAIVTYIFPANSKPSSKFCRSRNSWSFRLASVPPLSHSEILCTAPMGLSLKLRSKRRLGFWLISFDRRMPSLLPLNANEELNNSDVEVEKADEVKNKSDESQEAWTQTLESFKEEARKMKEISQEAYEVYSKRAMVILKETSAALKIQADKARHDMGMAVKEISKEGQVYLSTAAERSPESVMDIVETFASANELKDVTAVRDFYLGIPYGAFLVIGGFLSFMLTGSIPAIRFGIILGSALLALSVLSLRSWKKGQPSRLLLKGQAAIATILFIREWQLLWKVPSFITFLMIVISGAMLAFFIYRILIENMEGPRLEESSEK